MEKAGYIAQSEGDLVSIAEKLLQDFGSKRVILFYGEMGVGKTTLIKILCQQLGVEEPTNSPTFSIVNEYLSNQNKTIYHFDFYRIEKEEEVFDMGYEDYFYNDAYCFVEWPEMIPNLLPPDAVKVSIMLDADNNRIISVAH
jgi:tRNA threonylcarbamoyladenosine biosynthesis protein TsaE